MITDCKPHTRISPTRFLLFLQAFFGLLFLAGFLYVTWSRLAYPFEIEWIEGGVLHQVTRVYEGLPVYTRPSIDFIPALYTPLYYYVSAAFMHLTTWGFLPLRLVSLISTLGIVMMIWVVSSRYSGKPWLSILGACFYLATFRFTDYWFDVARVDSFWTLLLAIVLACLLLYRRKASVSLLLIAGCFYALAIFAKQSSLFLGPFLVLAIWLLAGWRGWLFFGLASILPVVLLFHYFQSHSDGLFYYYTMEMARSHGLSIFGLAHFLSSDSIFSVPAFILFSVLFCKQLSTSPRDLVALLVLLLGFTAISLVSRSYPGGHLNVLMPFYMCLSMMTAIYFVTCHGSSGSLNADAGSRKVFFLQCILLINLAWGLYLPSQQIPDAGNYQAGIKLVEKIRDTEGRVCVASHGYLAYMAGKDFCAHNTQLTDLLWASPEGIREQFIEELHAQVHAGYFSAILLDSKKELLDWELTYKDIPYAVHHLEGFENFRPVVSGDNPALWLEYAP